MSDLFSLMYYGTVIVAATVLGMQSGQQQQHAARHNDCGCQREKHRPHHVIGENIDCHGHS
jgi:hypothetical protein